MNVEHTKQLLDGVISAGGSDELIDALRSELDAKLTPITPDALDAAGWILSPEEEAYWSPLLSNNPCTVWVEPEGNNAIVEVEWYLEEQHIPFPDVATMYDLSELVRLLGGSQ